jgi:cobalamin biosynthesis protein CobW
MEDVINQLPARVGESSDCGGNQNKVKINLLTGFFGSGKTTLISYIIKYDKLKTKISIVQNEFSEEMGIEKEILRDSQGNILGDLYEMPNGCLCCAVK